MAYGIARVWPGEVVEVKEQGGSRPVRGSGVLWESRTRRLRGVKERSSGHGSWKYELAVVGARSKQGN